MEKVTKHDWRILSLDYHHAARVENCIIVFPCSSKRFREFFIYNIHTEQWGMFVIPDDEVAPSEPYRFGPCVITVEKEVYLFGDKVLTGTEETNHMWKLVTTPQQFYAWRKIKTGTKQNTPSPRSYHSGWEFSGKLWTFGGYGPPIEDSINDNGEWILGSNNQVLCFDPSSQEWTNPKCYGTVPSPRSGHASTIVGDHAWVFGGYSNNFNSCLNDLYQFDLMSLTWTEIQTTLAKPVKRKSCSLNAVSEHQLVLHGGSYGIFEKLNDTWVFDLQSLSWRQYAANKKFTWCNHIGTTGLDRSVIIIGGVRVCRDDDDDDDEKREEDDETSIDDDDDNDDDDDDNDDDGDDNNDDDVDEDGYCSDDTCTCAQIVTTIRLEPKSLQHLAIWTINQNQKVLPWKSCLPKSLIAPFLVMEMDEEADE